MQEKDFSEDSNQMLCKNHYSFREKLVEKQLIASVPGRRI